jgi:WD40 repeat protein
MFKETARDAVRAAFEGAKRIAGIEGKPVSLSREDKFNLTEVNLRKSPGDRRMIELLVESNADLLEQVASHDRHMKIEFSADKKVLVVNTISGVGLYKVENAKAQLVYRDHKNQFAFTEFQFADRGSVVLLKARSGKVFAWSPVAAAPTELYDSSRIVEITASENGERVAVLTQDSSSVVLDLVSGKVLLDTPRSRRAISKMVLSRNGTELVLVAETDIIILSVRRRAVMAKVATGQTKSVTKILFSPDQHKLAAASLDGSINVYRYDVVGKSFKLIFKQQGEPGRVPQLLAFDKTGANLYATWVAQEGATDIFGTVVTGANPEFQTLFGVCEPIPMRITQIENGAGKTDVNFAVEPRNGSMSGFPPIVGQLKLFSPK